MDKQQVTGAVFVDLKKAFDLVDHECLFYKLEHYGIRGQTLKLVLELPHKSDTKSKLCKRTIS
jgi:hypothetical protein